jgi:hypothetical protein
MYSIKSKKGMKFNKLTHLSIIVVLAIVFIVVYLYYTISDVKKIHNEVAKLTDDITKMNTSMSNISSTLTLLLTPAQCQPSQAGGVCNMPQAQITPIPVEVQQDDASSVNAQELMAIIETIEDEKTEVKEEVHEVVDEVVHEEVHEEVNDVANLDDIEEMMPQEPQTLKDLSSSITDLSMLSIAELKSVPYDTIKKYCKSNGIDNKGTKDVLIYRIKGVTA